MALEEYKRKRNFRKTPEPAGRKGAPKGRSFVIQKHAATRLHYDFRLELDGVLKSWAVPKGPSLDPAEKRLAVQVEDHPVDYGDFEGIIPKGQYGGGTVLLWDRGTWEPADGDPDAAFKKGKLKFRLHGEKLHGGWNLVRMHGDRAGEDKENWLLFKEKDEAAVPGSGEAIVKERPESVASGQSLEEIAQGSENVWESNRKASDEGSFKEKVRRAAKAPARPKTATARRAAASTATAKAGKETEVAGVRLSNPGKILYPGQGLTKLDLARYYEAVAERILPHLKDRPLTLVRCPEGQARQCFYQKHVSEQFPQSIHRVDVGEKRPYGAIDSLTGLLALIQMGVLELHIWGAHRDRIEQPDYIVFDLDPDEGLAWGRVAQGARTVRDRLADLGLTTFLKTTGGKGLHVVAPLTRRLGWDEVKAFTKAVAEAIVADEPALYTANLPKVRRQGKVFIDYLRNGRGATSICAYSTRARPGAPVSTPVAWEELDDPELSGNRYTMENLPARLAGLKSDPWDGFFKVRQSITAVMRKKLGLS